MLQCGPQLLQEALTRRTVEAGFEKVVTPLSSARVSFTTQLVTVTWVCSMMMLVLYSFFNLDLVVLHVVILITVS